MPIYNKITLNGTTLIDLSTDTVAVADDIASGKVGHLNTGSTATGTHSGGGSATVSRNDVNFYDYDGTILYSYSASDFANLNALPSNPTHSGLTAQGWNWTLVDAQTYVATYGKLDIGQMYVTDDGKTRIYINLVDSARLSPYLGICPNGTVVVDWGDRTSTDTLTGTSLSTVVRAQHTYATTGDYVITITVSSGSFAIYGTSSSTNGSYLLTRTNGNITSQRCYQNTIQKVELGTNVSIGIYAFSQCYSLTSITIPSSVTSIGNNAFRNCYSLASITIPSNVTSIDNSAFYYCYSLASITIPSNVTSIVNNALYNCYSLASITIPSSVTSISNSAFSGCYSLTSITIPSSVTSIGSYMVSSCYSLASITIPSSVTSIGSYTFAYCHSLASITIPSSVTSIDTYAFTNCYGVAEYHLLPTTPPTLSNANAFSSILSDCKIYVPSASLATYQSATNWSAYASKMVGE